MPHGRKLRHRGTQSTRATQLRDQVGLRPQAGEGGLPHHSTSHCIHGIAVAEGQKAGFVVSALQQPEDTSHVQLNRPNNSTQPSHGESTHTTSGGPSPL